MLKDIGTEVPKSIETRCSMQAKARDDDIYHHTKVYYAFFVACCYVVARLTVVVYIHVR